MLLKEHAVVEVHSGYFDICLIGESKFEATEPSVQVSERIREQLRPLGSSVGDLVLCSHSSGS